MVHDKPYFSNITGVNIIIIAFHKQDIMGTRLCDISSKSVVFCCLLVWI